MNKLDIIIVNWNSGRQLKSCLESVAKTKKDGFQLNHVFIVDNASRDDSLEGILESKLPITIKQNKENFGFATACNQGARESNADLLLFLNPDTILFENSLDKTIAFMQDSINSKVGICGIQLVNDKGEITRTCARFPKLSIFITKILGLNLIFPINFKSHFMTDWDHTQTRDVDQVMGAFFMIRRPLFEDLKGFDERFFVYFEEVDLSVRAKNMGWRSIYYSEVQAYHYGGGTSEQIKARRLFYSLRSRILYGYKHFNFISASILLIVTLFIEPFTRIMFSIVQRSYSQVQETIGGYFLVWKDIKNIILKIRQP
ncbi:MAG: glycosyltransferase family 2 protein [Calditrichaceae bacterium]